MNNPAGFFQKRGKGEEFWVQFKLERLSDFCYKCGLLSHVTGQCTFVAPARITSSSGIVAKLFGPWIQAESEGSILFLNPLEEMPRRRTILDRVKHIKSPSKDLSEILLFGDDDSDSSRPTT